MITTPTTPAETKPDTSGQIVYDTRAALAAVYEPMKAEIDRINAAFADVTAYYEELLAFEPTEANVDADNQGARKRFGDMDRYLYRLLPHHDGEKYPDEAMLDPQMLWRRTQEFSAACRGVANQFGQREKNLKAVDQAELQRKQRAAAYQAQEAAEIERVERLRRGEIA